MSKFRTLEEPREAVPQQPSYTDRQFLHTYSAGAFLPLTQASITALMAMIGTGTILYLFDAIEIMKPALVVGTLAWVLTWVYLQRRWLNLTTLETAFRVDLNRDGRIGDEPEPKPETVIRIDEVKGNGHFQSSTYRLPLSDRKLTTFAQGLLSGRPLSEREWCGYGRLMSSNEWRRLMHVMKGRELVQQVSEKDVRQGFELTPRGWAMMEQFAPEVAEAVVEDEEENQSGELS